MDEDERVFDDDEKQRAWLEGCRREEAISGLLERHGDKRLSIADVEEVAWELGVSRATLYRLIAAFRAKRTVSSVEPRSRGRRKNAFVLDRKREKLISLAIREIYLKPERPTMTYLIEQVRARCRRAELPPPDRRTIKARVDRIDRRVAALKRKDSKGVKATKAVPGQYVASRPLEVVQIDHTEVDLFLVDETTRKAMTARPWLTLAIDVFTRMVVGFHLSMDKPSRVSIGLCMLNAVYDKSAWLKENAIDARWPAAGLPEALHADNGADFRSRAFSWACREEGIKLIWRPAGAPHYGGHIERLIGTIMGRVHFYPGIDLFQFRGAARQRPRPFLGDDVPRVRMRPGLGNRGAIQSGDTQRASASAHCGLGRTRGVDLAENAKRPNGVLGVVPSRRLSEAEAGRHLDS